MYVLIFQNLIEPMIYKTVDYEMYMYTRTYLFKAFLLYTFQCMNMFFSFMLFNEIKRFLGEIKTDNFTV